MDSDTVPGAPGLASETWVERQSASGYLGTERLPSRAALQSLMWNAAGIVRNEDDLRAAQFQIRRWYIPNPTTIEARETANLLQLADAVITAALARRESRGAHFRADYPDPVDSERRHLTLTRPTPVPA